MLALIPVIGPVLAILVASAGSISFTTPWGFLLFALAF